MPSSAWKKDVCSRSEEHTSELQSLTNIVCRLLLEKNKLYIYLLGNPYQHYKLLSYSQKELLFPYQHYKFLAYYYKEPDNLKHCYILLLLSILMLNIQ